jgi:hypothetical protein
MWPRTTDVIRVEIPIEAVRRVPPTSTPPPSPDDIDLHLWESIGIHTNHARLDLFD